MMLDDGLFVRLLCVDVHSTHHSFTGAAEGNEKWGVKERALMASAGARAYNGGPSASGVQGQSPWLGRQGGEAPLKLKSFLLLDVRRKRQICPYSPCIADSVNYLNFQSNTDSGG